MDDPAAPRSWPRVRRRPERTSSAPPGPGADVSVGRPSKAVGMPEGRSIPPMAGCARRPPGDGLTDAARQPAAFARLSRHGVKPIRPSLESSCARSGRVARLDLRRWGRERPESARARGSSPLPAGGEGETSTADGLAQLEARAQDPSALAGSAGPD